MRYRWIINKNMIWVFVGMICCTLGMSLFLRYDNGETVLYRMLGIRSFHLVAALVGLTGAWYIVRTAVLWNSSAIIRKHFFIGAVNLVILVFFLLALKVIDSTRLSSSQTPGLSQQASTLYTLHLYPYTEWHIESNLSYRGAMAEGGTYGDSYEVTSGDHGFFVDFDLDNPPVKQPGELRVILIGGSGAMGFGARTNDDMLYRQLEKLLNESLAERELTARVINMAMAGSMSYQNFIALNKWGHRLEPDLILSFSGANDTNTYLKNSCDIPYHYAPVWGLVESQLNHGSVALIDWLAAYYPGITLKLKAALANRDRLTDQALAQYRESHGIADSVDMLQSASDWYADALMSIKRDFTGIPMIVALQPHEFKGGENCTRMYEMALEKLRGYYNDKWEFISVQDSFLTRDPGRYEAGKLGGVHLTNEGHSAAAEILLAPTLRLLDQVLAERDHP